MRIIFVGDVVGETGRKTLAHALEQWKKDFHPDAFIVNGENSAGGKGITPRIALSFMKQGVDAITLGDHVWDQPDLIPWLEGAPRVLRPFNLQPDTPGNGSVIVDTPAGKLGVLCLQGRTYMRIGAENPFVYAKIEAERLRQEGAEAVFVDFHAEATSEKIAMGYHLDGTASAVIGTHTHVQTNDACILPGGTAYLTDVGMCGSAVGVIGRDPQRVLESFVTSMPRSFPVAGWPARASGVLIETDKCGRAREIQLLNLTFTPSQS